MRKQGQIFPGKCKETRSRRRGGARALSRRNQRDHLPADRRNQSGHGLLRYADHRRSEKESAVRQDHERRAYRKPPARHFHYEGIAQLFAEDVKNLRKQRQNACKKKQKNVIYISNRPKRTKSFGRSLKNKKVKKSFYADVAELADAQVSGSCGNSVQVQLLSSAPKSKKALFKCFFCILVLKIKPILGLGTV